MSCCKDRFSSTFNKHLGNEYSQVSYFIHMT